MLNLKTKFFRNIPNSLGRLGCNIIIFLLPTLIACTKTSPVAEHEQNQRISSAEEQLVDDLENWETEEKNDPMLGTSSADTEYNITAEKKKGYLAKIKEYETILNEKLKRGKTKEVYGITVLKDFHDREKEFFTNLYTPYANIFLNEKYITNKHYTEDPYFLNLVTDFNKIIYLFVRMYPEYFFRKDILDQYFAAITSKCDPKSPIKLIGCEESFKLFKQDYNTSNILQIYSMSLLEKIKKLDQVIESCALKASCSDKEELEAKVAFYEAIKKYFQAIRIVFASRNSSEKASDAKAETLYIKGGHYYMRYVKQLGISKTEKEILIQVYNEDMGSMVASLMESLSTSNQQEHVKKMIKEVKFWENYSNEDSYVNENSWIRKLFHLAIDPRVINKKFISKEIAANALNREDEFKGPGFLKMIENLSPEEKSIFSNLGVSIDFDPSVSLYIINQIYLERWTIQEADSFWAGMGFNHMENNIFLQTSMNYLKFRTIEIILRSMDAMSRAALNVKNEENARSEIASSNERFEQIIDKSKGVNIEWVEFLKKLNKIQVFIERNLKVNNISSKTPSHEELDIYFSNIRKNIGILAVYPYMLTIIHYIASESSLKIGNISPSQIVRYFLFDYTKPWFSFGNEIAFGTPGEKFYVMHFLLRLDLFSKMKKAIGEYVEKYGNQLGPFMKEFDESTLFMTLFEYAFYSRTKMFKEDLSILKGHQLNATHRVSVEICREEQKPEGESRKYGTIFKSFESLEHSSFLLSYDATINDPMWPVNFVFGNNEEVIRILSYNRIEDSNHLVFLNTMLDIIKVYWKDLEESEQDPATKEKLIEKHEAYLEKMKNKMAEINNIRQEVSKLTLDFYTELEHCPTVFEQVDRKQKYRIYDMEITRLLQIHKNLKDLKRHHTQKETWKEEDITWEEEKTSMEQSFTVEARAESYLEHPGDVEPYDDIELTGSGEPVYRISKWDMMLRFAHRLEKINPNIDVILPSSNDLSHEKLFREGASPENKLTISYSEDPREFVKNAMRVVAKYLDWENGQEARIRMEMYKNKIDIMTNIYFLERMEMLSGDEPRAEKTVELEDIFMVVRDILHSNHIDDDKMLGENEYTEADYFRLLGYSNKYLRGSINGLFFETGRELNLPVYEHVFKLFNNNFNLFIVQKIESIAHTVNDIDVPALNHEVPRRTAKSLFLLPRGNDPVRTAIISNYKRHINTGLSIVDEVRNFIQEEGRREAKDGGFGPKGGFRFKINPDIDREEYEYDEDDFILTSISREDEGDDFLYIRRSVVYDYQKYVREFHVDTDCIFAEGPHKDYCDCTSQESAHESCRVD